MTTKTMVMCRIYLLNLPVMRFPLDEHDSNELLHMSVQPLHPLPPQEPLHPQNWLHPQEPMRPMLLHHLQEPLPPQESLHPQESPHPQE